MLIDVAYDLRSDDFLQIAAIKELLCGAKSIALVSHASADGDAVGSLTGLYAALKLCTKANVVPMLPDGVPEDYAWLPNTDAVIDGSRDMERCIKALMESDVIVGTDFSLASRIGSLGDTLTQSKAKKIVIDHHHSPDREGFDFVVSIPELSSASELVYWVLKAMWGKEAISSEVATSLYCGIRTDTGGMSYGNTMPSLYLATAELVQCGIDPMLINQKINNTFSEHRMRFYGYAMSTLMKVYANEGVAVLAISREDMIRFGIKQSEITGLVNELMRMRDVECAALLREVDDRVRVSLRSKTDTDVNMLARELFPIGGGHTHAAGATSMLSLGETVKLITDRLLTIKRSKR